MSTVTLQGHIVHLSGHLPHIGESAPAFTLTKTDLTEVTLKDFEGKQIILNIFPSLDTTTCALSVKRFNSEAAKFKDVVILCISMDLPFAQARFCGAEGINQVIPVSAFRHHEFGRHYGVEIADSKLAGLFARSVVIINPRGAVSYCELVKEISEEPNYQAALDALP